MHLGEVHADDSPVKFCAVLQLAACLAEEALFPSISSPVRLHRRRDVDGEREAGIAVREAELRRLHVNPGQTSDVVAKRRRSWNPAPSHPAARVAGSHTRRRQFRCEVVAPRPADSGSRIFRQGEGTGVADRDPSYDGGDCRTKEMDGPATGMG